MTIQMPPPVPPAPPTRDGAKVALVAAIVVSALLLVGVAATALVLALGGSDTSDADGGNGSGTADSDQTAEDALREFLDASVENDCEVLALHPVTQLRSAQECEDMLDDARDEAEDSGLDFDSFVLEVDDLEVTDETDTTAAITVETTQSYTYDGTSEEYSTTSDYELEKKDGRWLVTDVANEPAAPADPVGPDGE